MLIDFYVAKTVSLSRDRDYREFLFALPKTNRKKRQITEKHYCPVNQYPTVPAEFPLIGSILLSLGRE